MAVSIAGGVRPGKLIELEKRLYQHLIVGKHKAAAMDDVANQKLEDDANKLEIERLAIQARLEKQAKAQAVFEAVSKQLIDTVSNDIEHQLASPDLLLKSTGLQENHILLLDLLLDKDPDISRIRPIISNISWLKHDLVTLINSPASRHRRPKSSDVQVTDIKLVLNYIGLENLRLLIPYFCLRNWLPSGHTNLVWTSRKLWRYSMITAIAAQALAVLHNRPLGVSYTCALLYQMGTSFILGSSAKIYEKHWGNWLRESSHSRDKEVYDAVMATEFPAEQVLKHVISSGHNLNWQLLSHLGFDDSSITQVLKELDHDYHYNELSIDASIVAKASCFAKILLLEEHQLLEPQERRVMLDYYEFSQQEIIRLKAQNYRKLDLA
ncbi:HDOD domain-containing protein [Shewanella aestuarii]|uniref:HDOD domain-containing protein n=1 Tax=Shewanella aestuarii TaxID=1028752 RepID=A0A6G9QGM4_9GAMM|nr:HDOD domain-containing protein [Shewanella aestuarii]QIR13626.1 HDOD domain-containing protein [Shewanella aestuarii]